MPEPRLIPARDGVLDPAAEIAVGDDRAKDLWRDLLLAPEIQNALIESAIALVEGMDTVELPGVVSDRGLPDWMVGATRSLAAVDPDIDRAPRTEIRFLYDARHLGSGRNPFDELLATAALLAETDRVPTIAIRLRRSFVEGEGDDATPPRRDQREDVLRLLRTLAKGCDVRIMASPITLGLLLKRHADDLPTEFSERCNTPLTPGTAAAADVETACRELDPNGRPLQILRDLADEPAGTLPLGALIDAHGVTAGTITQHATGDDAPLRELGLVESFAIGDGQKALELTTAGREVVEFFDSEIGRQRSLSDEFSDPGKSVSDSRVSPPAHEAPQEGEAVTAPDRNRLADRHRTEFLARSEQHAVLGAAVAGNLVAVDHPIEPLDDRGTRLWGYDGRDGTVVVGAEHDNPCQWSVCDALALADPLTFDRVLTDDVLEAIDIPDVVMRQARCVGGWSKDVAADPTEFPDRIEQWREELAELTRKLRHREYEDRNTLRSEITRSAKGLAATMVHVLDLADIDIVRFVRVPRGRDFGADDWATLERCLAHTTAIESRWHQYAAYRQLFETREDKRRQAITPDVPADDPVGTPITTTVIAGPGVSDRVDDLKQAVRRPGELQEDAPEITVPVTVAAPGRAAIATTARRLLRRKNLTPTREAVSLLSLLTGTVFDVVEALRWLGSEDQQRRLRPDEVRYALGQLDADRIVPHERPTVRATVHALLVEGQSGPLTQSELADAAGVSARSVRNNADRLAALGLVAIAAAGEGRSTTYRLQLPTRDERRNGPLPWFLADDTDVFVRDVVAAVVEQSAAPARWGDPADPVTGPWLRPGPTGLPDWATILDEPGWEWLRPWVDRLATALDDPLGELSDGDRTDREQTVRMGPAEIAQQPLPTAGGQGVVG